MTATSTSVKSSTTIPSPLLPSDVREDLCRYAEAGGFTLRAETNPWFAALDSVTDVEEARAASTVLAELRGRDLPLLQQTAEQLSAVPGFDAPGTVAETAALAALVLRVRGTLDVLHAPVYEGAPDALSAMIAATASSAWRAQNGVKQSWLQRRALTRQARLLAVTRRTRRDALHGALAAAASERADWSALAADGGRPALPSGLALAEGTGQAADSAVAGLQLLTDLIRPELPLADLPLADLTALLDRLAADEGTLFRLPRLRTLRDGLLAQDLDELLAELTAQEAGVAETTALLARASVPQPSTEPQPEPTPAASEAEADAEVEAVTDADAEVEPEAEVEAAVETEAEAAAEAEPEAEVEVPAEVEVAAELEAAVEAEAAAAAEFEPEAEAEVKADAEAEAEAEVEVAAETEAVVEAEAEVIVEPEAAVEAEVEVIVEAEAAVESEPEAGVGAEAEVVAEVESELEAAVEAEAEVVVEAEAAVEVAVEAEPEAEAKVETDADTTAEAEAQAEPQFQADSEAAVAIAEQAEAETVAVETETEAAVDVVEATAAPAAEAPSAPAARRPRKPAFTPGQPVTAYSADQLEAVVRWIDGDSVERSDEELLRAAMKEFGFSRLGPRIKEALGAAVTAVRG